MNVGNCFIIKFDNGTRLVDYRYFVNGTRVTEQRSLKDLGAIRDSHLKFREHIDYMTPRLLKPLDFYVNSRANLKIVMLSYIYIEL